MKKAIRIEVNHKDLPLVLEVKGENGEKTKYALKPAGKGKVGARLASPKEV